MTTWQPGNQADLADYRPACCICACAQASALAKVQRAVPLGRPVTNQVRGNVSPTYLFISR
ncbi:hypothetical protein, partial [Pseudomonas sp. K5]|uniref:hypothetical protein n=1 Tax=Pseudomonas sp. K5 TaxID=1156313 RepID=UPI001D001C25